MQPVSLAETIAAPIVQTRAAPLASRGEVFRLEELEPAKIPRFSSGLVPEQSGLPRIADHARHWPHMLAPAAEESLDPQDGSHCAECDSLSERKEIFSVALEENTKTEDRDQGDSHPEERRQQQADESALPLAPSPSAGPIPGLESSVPPQNTIGSPQKQDFFLLQNQYAGQHTQRGASPVLMPAPPTASPGAAPVDILLPPHQPPGFAGEMVGPEQETKPTQAPTHPQPFPLAASLNLARNLWGDAADLPGPTASQQPLTVELRSDTGPGAGVPSYQAKHLEPATLTTADAPTVWPKTPALPNVLKEDAAAALTHSAKGEPDLSNPWGRDQASDHGRLPVTAQPQLVSGHLERALSTSERHDSGAGRPLDSKALASQIPPEGPHPIEREDTRPALQMRRGPSQVIDGNSGAAREISSISDVKVSVNVTAADREEARPAALPRSEPVAHFDYARSASAVAPVTAAQVQASPEFTAVALRIKPAQPLARPPVNTPAPPGAVSASAIAAPLLEVGSQQNATAAPTAVPVEANAMQPPVLGAAWQDEAIPSGLGAIRSDAHRLETAASPGQSPSSPGKADTSDGALLEQFAQKIRQSADQSFEIELQPRELGKLTIQLRPTSDGISVQITTERSDTQELVRRHIEDLARDLRNLGHSSVAFGFSQSGQHQAERWAGRELRAVASRTPDLAEQPSLPSPPAKLGFGAVDIRI